MKWFVLDINPEPWKVGPVSIGRSKGKLFPIVGRDQQLDAFKEAVREEIGPQPLIPGKVKLEIYFWRNRADFKTQADRAHRKHEADLTNMQKATEDALQSTLFANDRDVSEIHSVLVDQGPEVQGRIVIGVEQIENMPDIVHALPQPVWDLMDKLDRHVVKKNTLEWGDDSDAI